MDGVNKIWRDAKLRGVGMKRATKLVDAAGHSIGSREGLTTARMEIKNLCQTMRDTASGWKKL